MIIRERDKEFVMIEQHHHATISGKLYLNLKEAFVPSSFAKEVEFAIFNHDCAWIPFDATPFWDDESNVPYSFTSFPRAPKTVLYENGINQVEETSTYASLLCSKHYTSFMKMHSIPLVTKFLESEAVRRERLKKNIQGFNEGQFQQHYELLKFFDDLSLYICLNEPGVEKEQEHPFFKNGISLPQSFGEGKVQTAWTSEGKIELNEKLFKAAFTIILPQKVVSKTHISEDGLQKAYENTEIEEVSLTIT